MSSVVEEGSREEEEGKVTLKKKGEGEQDRRGSAKDKTDEDDRGEERRERGREEERRERGKAEEDKESISSSS